MPRRLLPVLLAALVAAPLLAAAPASGQGVEFTVTPAKVEVTDGPEGDERTFSLDTDLYVPETATAEDPQPAIVMTNGFGLSKTAAEVTSMASFLASHGYVVLAYSAAGFGGSGGCITLQSADFDAKSTSELITDVLAARPEVLKDDKGPVVGTVGGSYGGGGQLVLAAQDDRVRAAAPGRTWSYLQYSLDPNNLVLPDDPTGFDHTRHEQGVFKASWASLFVASGNAQPIGGAPPSGGPKGGCPQEKLASGDPSEVAGLPCLGFPSEVCSIYARVVATGDITEADRRLLARASAAEFYDQVDIPVLLVQGQRDTLFNVNDAVATYTALKARGVPVTMIWNSGGHGGYDSLPGECEVYGGGTTGLDDCYLTLRTLDFFDEALRGEPDPGPEFAFHRDWVLYEGTGSADEQYGTAPAFPTGPTTTFTLSGTGQLALPGEPVVPGSAAFVNPPGGQPAAYSETPNSSGPRSALRDPRQPMELPGQHVAFTSAPFPTDVESVGVPSAVLPLTHANGRDLVLFGRVYDVAPDGSAQLVHRLSAPVRVPAGMVGQPVEVKLLGFAHRFEAGHAVRLVLASTDMAYRNATVADRITVATGAPATFTLPGAVAAPPATGPAPAAPPPAAAPPAAAPPAAGSLPATGPEVALPAAALLLLLAAGVVRRRVVR